MSATTATPLPAESTVPARRRFPSGKLLRFVVPVFLLFFWWIGTAANPSSLIPSPSEVGTALWDLAFGGINDDAFSQMLLTDLIASASRVYGAFLLAAALALPLGMLIGRLPVVHELLEPTLQVLRPVPITAWLPLSMIMFGLGPRSAFFLVALGAFYPILATRSWSIPSLPSAASSPACSRPPRCLAFRPPGCFPRSSCPPLFQACSPACVSVSALPGSSSSSEK